MPARANWHTPVLDGLEDEPDLFAAPIEEVGERIDLRDPEAMLKLRLDELVRREGHLFERSTTCAIKDRSDTTCHACPVSKAGDPEAGAMHVLCRIGREQEIVLTEMAVLRCQDR